MKVVITGTHSSGKTTLAKHCSERFGMEFVRGDTIHDIITQQFPGKTYDNLTKKEYWDLENIGLENRVKAEKEEVSFISDGCTLNSVVYARAKLGKRTIPPEDFAKFSRIAINNAKNYDYIFYLPPEIPLVDNNLRPLDKKFRLLVDNLLLKILKDFKFYTLTGSVEERSVKIERILFPKEKFKVVKDST